MTKQQQQQPMTDAQLQTRAQMMKALGHPARLRIVEYLAINGERCVCELTELVALDISTVSKHLSLLKRAGILRDRKVGLNVYYSLLTPCILQIFNCIGQLDTTNLGKAQ